MTGTVIRVISRQVLLLLSTVCLVSPFHVELENRETTKGLCNPCFTNYGEEPAVLRPFNESISDIKTRTAGLKHDAELLKDFLTERYQISDNWSQQLDAMNWTNENVTVTEAVVKAAINKPNETLKSHFRLLSEYSLYIKQILKDGPLAEKKSEEETWEMLDNFETKLNSCMCSLKIALLSSGIDVASNETKYILNPIFMANSSPLTNAIYRAYITMQDGINLVKFLNTIYQNLEESTMKKASLNSLFTDNEMM